MKEDNLESEDLTGRKTEQRNTRVDETGGEADAANLTGAASHDETDLAIEEARGFADQVPIDGWEQRPPELSRELIISQEKGELVDYTKGRLLTRRERGLKIGEAGGKEP